MSFEMSVYTGHLMLQPLQSPLCTCQDSPKLACLALRSQAAPSVHLQAA